MFSSWMFWQSNPENSKLERAPIQAKKETYLQEARQELNASHPARLPFSLKCALTQFMLKNPIITKHGSVYEREKIQQWLLKSPIDPLTQQSLSIDEIYDFPELKSVLGEYIIKKKRFLDIKNKLLEEARKAAHDPHEEELPSLFICPISGNRIEKAVISDQGIVYDEASLKEERVDKENRKMTLKETEPFDEFTQQIKLFFIYQADLSNNMGRCC